MLLYAAQKISALSLTYILFYNNFYAKILEIKNFRGLAEIFSCNSLNMR